MIGISDAFQSLISNGIKLVFILVLALIVIHLFLKPPGERLSVEWAQNALDEAGGQFAEEYDLSSLGSTEAFVLIAVILGIIFFLIYSLAGGESGM